jgi:hypothetical protein
MPQWEYKIIDLGSARTEQGEIILNAMGEQGWELVAVSVNANVKGTHSGTV